MNDRQIKIFFFLALTVGVVVYSFYSFKKESREFDKKVSEAVEIQKKEIQSAQPQDLNPPETQILKNPIEDPSKIEISGDKSSKIGLCTKIIIKVLGKEGKSLEKSNFSLKIMDGPQEIVLLSNKPDCSDLNPKDSMGSLIQIQTEKPVFEKYAIFKHKGKVKAEAYFLNGNILPLDDSKAPLIELNEKLLKIDAEVLPESIVPYSSINFQFSIKDSELNIYDGLPKEISLYLAKDEKSGLSGAILLDKQVAHKASATFSSIFIKDTEANNYVFIAFIDKDISSTFVIKKEPFKKRKVSISVSDKKGLFSGTFIEPRVVEVYGKKYPVIDDGDKLYVMFEDKKYRVEIIDNSFIQLIR